MPQDVRLWAITPGDQLATVERCRLDLESRIEQWLVQDISILSGDLLLIGRQVETAYGGVIDLLCLDSRGDVVLVELKRDKTPRDITAQVLDYASWVRDLSNEELTERANAFLKDDGPLEAAFQARFGA